MSTPRIEDYAFGHIVIDGERYEEDVIILPDRVVSNWWREEGHTLQTEDLEAVFETDVDVLVVGQGAYGRMSVPQEVEQALEEAGIEVVAHDTEEACQTYNRLRENGDVAAALHLTC
ncbi:MAG: Mth938-like domain-containing protein [Chloroflexota bacterium]|nr:Mth938-like domain-containing protein [Chloroflexota bacterium]